jgi:hypothetical protein
MRLPIFEIGSMSWELTILTTKLKALEHMTNEFMDYKGTCMIVRSWQDFCECSCFGLVR